MRGLDICMFTLVCVYVCILYAGVLPEQIPTWSAQLTKKCSEPERQRTEQVRGIAHGKGARRDALRWLQLCSYSWL